jgi:polar amino acid transport system substrate-binding protein
MMGSTSYYLLVRNDTGVKNIAGFEKDDKLQLGVIRSFRYSESANRMVDKLQTANRISQAGGLAPLYQTLMQGQIQAMIIEPFDFPALDEKKIREMSTILEFNDPAVPHGVIMSKKSLSSSQQDQWRNLVNAMRSDGTMKRIFEKYFKPELATSLVTF